LKVLIHGSEIVGASRFWISLVCEQIPEVMQGFDVSVAELTYLIEILDPSWAYVTHK
jgi:hypothetical protein